MASDRKPRRANVGMIATEAVAPRGERAEK
jgi:hypothetical protein